MNLSVYGSDWRFGRDLPSGFSGVAELYRARVLKIKRSRYDHRRIAASADDGCKKGELP
jgi:hypothetical protein